MRDIFAGASALPSANREDPQMKEPLVGHGANRGTSMRNLLLDIHPWLGQSIGPSRGTSHLRAIKRNNCIMHLVDH